MPQTRYKVPSLWGGTSTQPPHLRHDNQLGDARNCVLSVARGAEKRAGSKIDRAVTGLTASANYRLHAIDRDDTEQYQLLYGTNTLRAFKVGSATEALVYKAGASRLYLSGVTADNQRLLTIADTTIIASTTTATAAVTSPSFSPGAEAVNAGSLFNTTPASGTYHHASQDDEIAPAGWWLYNPGPRTYATVNMAATTSASWGQPSATAWGADTANPIGFRIFFVRFSGTTGITGATIAADGVTLTKTGAFTNYTETGNDWINITGGTNTTAGHYRIARRTSADSIVLATDITTDALSHSDVTFDGVGLSIEPIVNFLNETYDTMDDIASIWTRAMQSAGATNALCAWNKTSTGGYFTITSPFAGTPATFPSTSAIRAATTSGVYGITGVVNSPFSTTIGTVTAGTGPSTATFGLDVSERWTRVPASTQSEAVFDDSTMPQALTRVHPGGTYASGFATYLKKFNPFGHWRFGEATGTTAFDETGLYNGTYVASPTLGATGSVNGDSNTAVTFASASSQYVNVGTLGNMGSRLDEGLTIFCVYKGTTTTRQAVFAAARSGVGTGLTSEVHFWVNATSTSTNQANRLFFMASDISGSPTSGYADVTGGVNINDGNFHTLVVTCIPGSVAPVFYVDGVAQTTAGAGTGGGSFENFRVTAAWGAWLNGSTVTSPLNATLDECAIFLGVMDASTIAALHGLRASSSYSLPATFVLSPINWTARLSGDSTSNPLVQLVDNGKAVTAMAYHDDRFIMAGGPYIACSASGDLFNFFVDDSTNLTDADPISAPISDASVANVTDLVPFASAVLVLTDSPRQFELSGGGGNGTGLTPSTVAITPSTTYNTQSVRPVSMDARVYFAATGDNGSRVVEYFTDDTASPSQGFVVTAHVDDLLPTTLRTLAKHNNSGTMLALPSSAYSVWVYRSFWAGGEKKQSAWCEWRFDSSLRIADISVIGDELWMLTEYASAYTLERVQIDRPVTDSGYPYHIHLDRKQYVTGVHAAGTTTWTLPYAAVGSGSSQVAIVKSSAWGGTAGDAITVATASGTTVTATGDYSAQAVAIGRISTFLIELSRPFLKDQTGRANIDARMSYRDMTVQHQDTGHYLVRSALTLRTDRTTTFTPASGHTQEYGSLRCYPLGDTRRQVVTIESTSPKPTIITSVEMILDVDGRVPQ